MKEALNQLKDTFKGNMYGFVKYFDFDSCIKAKQPVYKWLDISANSSILDISSGFGYFPYICQKHGHTVTVTDVCGYQDKICTEVREVLGLPKAVKFEYTNRKFKKLPKDIGTFDLITAFSVGPHSFFSKEDWINYINDCKEHLNDGGRIYIEPNISKGFDELLTLNGRYGWTTNKIGLVIKKENING